MHDSDHDNHLDLISESSDGSAHNLARRWQREFRYNLRPICVGSSGLLLIGFESGWPCRRCVDRSRDMAQVSWLLGEMATAVLVMRRCRRGVHANFFKWVTSKVTDFDRDGQPDGHGLRANKCRPDRAGGNLCPSRRQMIELPSHQVPSRSLIQTATISLILWSEYLRDRVPCSEINK